MDDVGRAPIYVKLPPVFLQQESDGAAAFQKTGSLADGEYAGTVQELEDSSVALGLRSAHANQPIGREAFPAASKLMGPYADRAWRTGSKRNDHFIASNLGSWAWLKSTETPLL